MVIKAEKFPLFSVIIVAYERKEYIQRAIKSVIEQTLDKANYEILVVKNFRMMKLITS